MRKPNQMAVHPRTDQDRKRRYPTRGHEPRPIRHDDQQVVKNTGNKHNWDRLLMSFVGAASGDRPVEFTRGQIVRL